MAMHAALRKRQELQFGGIDPWGNRPMYGALVPGSIEAKAEAELVDALVDHLGGNPTPSQALLVRRAARLCMMCSLLEARILGHPEKLGDLEGRQVLAFSNSLRLTLVALGLERHEPKIKTLASYVVGQSTAVD